ncbi:MAG: ferritin-like domain-containing protein [Gemmatimonadetes bacterium]|nr:ferritin-like domain-containing protein [Gemmatimonadota bacterium]
MTDLFDSIAPVRAGRTLSRREAVRTGAAAGFSVVSRLALASVPVAIAGVIRDAHAQGAPSILDVLNYALTLEYLEDEFYRIGLSAPVGGTLTAAERNTIEQVSMHETAHVAFLQATIRNLQGTPVPKPAFDFTAGGVFGDVFSNRVTFLAVAQTFEDTGVRAYKGQAGNIMSNDTVLTAALQIHSVEARHASQIRRLRGQKGWITNADRGDLPPQAQPTYDGEANTVHAGLDAAPFGSGSGGPAAVTEAFDEPLTMPEVLAIVRPFIVG